jgi:alpha-L-rhamnosidase
MLISFKKNEMYKSASGAASSPKTLVVYGTSLSAERTLFWRRVSGQWVGLLRRWAGEQWPGCYRIVNASRWGATSLWAEVHLGRRVLQRNPVCVILEFAINDADVRRSISLAAARAHLQAITTALQQRLPDCRVVILLTNPCYGRYAEARPDLADYYAVYREYAVANGIAVIDLYTAWKNWIAANPDSLTLYLPDGLHPAAVASGELIFPQVKKRLHSYLAATAQR